MTLIKKKFKYQNEKRAAATKEGITSSKVSHLEGRARHPTPGPRTFVSESEEYDSFASDSETDAAISSRTESSNPRDPDRSATSLSVHHSKLLYHL